MVPKRDAAEPMPATNPIAETLFSSDMLAA